MENHLQLLQPPKFDRICLTYVSPFPVFKKVVYNRYTPFSDTSTSTVFVSGGGPSIYRSHGSHGKNTNPRGCWLGPIPLLSWNPNVWVIYPPYFFLKLFLLPCWRNYMKLLSFTTKWYIYIHTCIYIYVYIYITKYNIYTYIYICLGHASLPLNLLPTRKEGKMARQYAKPSRAHG